MSEKVLARIQVMKQSWWEDVIFHEVLVIKPDRVFVAQGNNPRKEVTQ